MSQKIEKEIQLIQNHLDALINVGEHSTNDYGVSIWKAPTINTLARIFGKDSETTEQLRNLNLYRDVSKGSGINQYDIDGFKKSGRGILESAITEIKELGLPDNQSERNGINLTVIQNQEQNQKLDAKIVLEAFQNELTGTQLKELQEILEEKSEPEEKKKKVVDKLVSFGKDVATNIVANIIANPSLWG